MPVGNQQIGWSNEAKLLQNILKQVERLTGVIASGGGGATTLGALTDVSIVAPIPGDVLTYNGSVWVNAPVASGISGTANRIPKFTSATTIGDSSITDDGTTVSVASTLSVVSTSDHAMNVGSSGATSNPFILINQAGVTKGTIQWLHSLNTLMLRSDTGTLMFNTNGLERMRITPSGDVGIASEFIAPDSRLHVRGDIRMSLTGNNKTGVLLTSPANDQATVAFRASDDSHRFDINYLDANLASERLAFVKGLGGPAEVLSVLTNGKIGIGTTAPAANLHVKSDNGGVLIENNLFTPAFTAGAFRPGALSIARVQTDGTGEYNTMLQLVSYFSGAAGNSSKVAIEFKGGDGNGVATTTPGRIYVQTSYEPAFMDFQVESVSKFRLSSGGASVFGDLYVDGNTAITGSLAIGYSGTASAQVEIHDYDNDNLCISNDIAGSFPTIRFKQAGVNVGLVRYNNGVGGMTIESGGGNNMAIYTNGVERIKIQSDGSWYINGTVGTAGQSLRSQGPGLPVYWG